MIKYVCNRCGFESHNLGVTIIEYQILNGTGAHPLKIHLCDKCKEQFIEEWIYGNKPEEGKNA